MWAHITTNTQLLMHVEESTTHFLTFKFEVYNLFNNTDITLESKRWYFENKQAIENLTAHVQPPWLYGAYQLVNLHKS